MVEKQSRYKASVSGKKIYEQEDQEGVCLWLKHKKGNDNELGYNNI